MSTAKKKNVGALHKAAVVLGRIVGLSGGGVPLVEFAEAADAPREARTTVPIDATHVGAEVTLQFIDGDPTRPVVVGLLCPEPSKAERQVRILANGETLRLSADREIVLECGKASITLRRDGKLVLRGESILSRATGVHRIRGGTVLLN